MILVENVTNNFFSDRKSEQKILIAFFTKTFRFKWRPEFNFRSLRGLIFNDLAKRKSNSGLAPQRNVFVKNGIKTFCLYIRQEKQLLVTFYPKLIPLGITAGTFLTSPGTLLSSRLCMYEIYPDLFILVQFRNRKITPLPPVSNNR